MHLEVIGCNFTASAVAGSVAAANTGDSFTIKNAREGSRIHLVDVIGFWGSLGEIRVVGPHFNDTTQGIRLPVIPAIPQGLLGGPACERLYPQDTLAVTFFGTATGAEVNVGGLCIWYEDLPGITATMLTVDQLRTRGQRVVPVSCLAVASAATGDWGGSEALNADSDLLKPNTDYAVLGLSPSIITGLLAIRSPSWGNVRVAAPGGTADHDKVFNYFVHLAERTGLPCIPVLNSGNKASTFVDVAQDEVGANPDVHVNLVELSPS